MFHSRATGSDLHAPSNQTVLNKSGLFIPRGTVVKTIGVSSDGVPEVMPVESLMDSPFGVTWDNILENNLGMICIIGIYPLDTGTAVPGDQISFRTTGQLTVDNTGSHIVGKVLGTGFTQLNFMSIETEVYDWDLRGNILDDDSSRLGSLNNKDFSVVTNGQTRTFYSKNGQVRFGDKDVKSDFRYQFSNNITHHSGVLLDNFSASNPSVNFLTIWNHEIPEFTLQTFNVHLIAKKGNKKAVFDYTITVSREDGLAVINHIQSDYQVKVGASSFRPKFSVSLTNFKVEVSNPTDLDTVWSGYVLSHASF